MRFPFVPLAAATLVLVSGAQAATVHVPADEPTIQGGLLAASPGDTVLVAPGSYRELILMTCGVTLRSSDGPEATVLLSPGIAEKIVDERLMHVPEGCDRSTVIEGFSFNPAGISGTALYVERASPTIRGNRFVPSYPAEETGSPDASKSVAWGFAIYLKYSDALIEDNFIDGVNTRAILCRASSPEIYRNTIQNCIPQAINIVGKESKPIIGGSPENGNKLLNNFRSVANESVNDIVATYNDWGWEIATEMDRKGYPADISVIFDGNEEGKRGLDRGKVDYRHWVSPRDEAAGGGGTAGGRTVPWAIILAVAMIVAFVVMARRRAASA